jgi:hypothetical protein|tara:strand:- start:475 stop:630 length:156 start_codon:yes stop_codon:yes gene_type:complete
LSRFVVEERGGLAINVREKGRNGEKRECPARKRNPVNEEINSFEQNKFPSN